MALLLSGCAGGDPALQKEVAGLRAELRTMQRENEELARKVDVLSGRVEVLSARPAQRAEAATVPAPAAALAPGPSPAAAPASPPAHASAPLVPPNLKVVRLKPGPPARGGGPTPIPTSTPVREPDAVRPTAPAAQGVPP